MTTSALNAQPLHLVTSEAQPAAAGIENDRALEAALQACRRIAPLWPLQHFVAVNPFLGLVDQRFADAAGLMSRAAGARMTMPRGYYANAITSGRIADTDLAAAIARARPAIVQPDKVQALKLAAASKDPGQRQPLRTVADVASRVTGKDWASFACDRISTWAASYFDDGQAAWNMPWRELPPYQAWRKQALIDRTPELQGLTGFRLAIKALPDDAEAMLSEGATRLGLRAGDRLPYFHRLLMSIGGWASYARYRVWQSELRGANDNSLIEWLAIRVAWDVAILLVFDNNPKVTQAWRDAREMIGEIPDTDTNFAIDELLLSAHENAWQREFLGKLCAPREERPVTRPAVQAAFCIDVRSEVFRRALESTSPQICTMGFAGFFGFPIEYVPLGQTQGNAQCPALLKPRFTVYETVQDASPSERWALLGKRRLRKRAAQAWRSFKTAAVSSFAFVETMGWTYLAKLASDGFGLTRVVPHPAVDGLSQTEQKRLRPDIATAEIAGRITGFTPRERLQMAESVLKAMSLSDGFARLVLLAGHGSSTVNNPHASGLDCGACGGHTGEANARVAAAILNDPAVRAGLLSRQIVIPESTVFVAGLHDTTTDEVTLFDLDSIPAGHAEDLRQLRSWLKQAGKRTRAERGKRLPIDNTRPVDAQLIARSRDWSQPRPEWGLAGCAAFIAAPRHQTRGVDLDGKVFLHSYDWRQDADWRVLELIMTAPMVVATWINLQYYGSTVDNRVFGSGNKVLHNVVGSLGVLEGNSGDLRSGLPWQSVHDGERLVHEPLRLSVVLAAPVEAINQVISRHQEVRQLVDNGWIHLFAMPEGQTAIRRYRGHLAWENVA
ncbi:MAG: DUF2309 domain-containing protein [Rhodanobacteraceae bacterium]